MSWPIKRTFVEWWVGYKTCFQIWDNDGNPLLHSPNSFPLILVMHNKSTFFQNNERKTCWSHQDSQPSLKLKGDGQSLMVSDFLTAEWGRLCDGNRCIFFSCSLLITLQGGPHRF
jgi:hypothetical protein